jgi:hypothetical protein
VTHHIFYIIGPELEAPSGCLHQVCASVRYDRTIEGGAWWATGYADRRVQELKSRKGIISAWHQPDWHKGAFV